MSDEKSYHDIACDIPVDNSTGDTLGEMLRKALSWLCWKVFAVVCIVSVVTSSLAILVGMVGVLIFHSDQFKPHLWWGGGGLVAVIVALVVADLFTSPKDN
jgi:hypothetical protein